MKNIDIRMNNMRFAEFKDEDLTPSAGLFVSIFNEEQWNYNCTIETARRRLKDFSKTPTLHGVCCHKETELVGYPPPKN
ncbi:MAG: hypothetical protein ACLFUR_06275 [Candidatus Hadarchaeia archaeon]